MLRKIKIYGKLRQLIGKTSFEADLNNVGQAFSFLCCNYPEIVSHLQNQVYKVYSGDKVITDETLNMTGNGEIKIIPVATGSGFLVPFFAPALSGFIGGAVSAAGLGGIIGGVVTAGLTSLAISGVTSLLSPQPQARGPSGMERTDPSSLASNYSFSGITNIAKAGGPINLIYGETIVGSVTVSNGIDTVQVRGDA
jgi:predicted phage tail protein|tara:strand:+ start:1617 stop:2204 length:588 start_codon:yes stop_codon:yes gene_type:complete